MRRIKILLSFDLRSPISDHCNEHQSLVARIKLLPSVHTFLSLGIVNKENLGGDDNDRYLDIRVNMFVSLIFGQN